jgi:hypothetical protein
VESTLPNEGAEEASGHPVVSNASGGEEVDAGDKPDAAMLPAKALLEQADLESIGQLVKPVGAETTRVEMTTERIRIEGQDTPEMDLILYEPVLFRVVVTNKAQVGAPWAKNLGTEATALELLVETRVAPEAARWSFASPGWRPFGARGSESGEYGPGESLLLYRSYSRIVLMPPPRGAKVDYLCQTAGTLRVLFAVRSSGAVLANPMILRVRAPRDEDQTALEFLLAHDLPKLLDPEAELYLVQDDRQEAVKALQEFLIGFGDSRYAPWARIGLLRLLLANEDDRGVVEEANRFLTSFPRSPFTYLVSAWLASALLAAGDLAGAAASIERSENDGEGVWAHEGRIAELRRELERLRGGGK